MCLSVRMKASTVCSVDTLGVQRERGRKTCREGGDGEGKSSHQEYRDLRLHELQLSTAQRMSYCYARAQSAQLEIREGERGRTAERVSRARERKPRDGEERAGEETSEQRAGRLQLDLLLAHTLTPLYLCLLVQQSGNMSSITEGIFLSPP